MVRITQESYLSMLDEEDARPSFFTRLMGFPSITASVNYVDYTVARAILAAVRDWVDALDSTKTSRLSRYFLKNEIAISSALPSMLATSVLIGAAGIAYHLNTKIAFTVIIAFALSTLLFGIGSLVTEWMMSSIYKLQQPTTILITKGDATHKTQIGLRKRRSQRTLGFVFGFILFGIIINVLSSFIYSWLVK